MLSLYNKNGKSHIVVEDQSLIIANIIIALHEMKSNIGHFPVYGELKDCEYSNLFSLVQSHGGISFFRKLMGYEENYRSALASYITRRGKNTEHIVLEILKDHCKQNNLPSPNINHTFDDGSRIELLCETGSKIGIDVTNTRTIESITTKWTKRKYHEYVDKLFIVVFSNTLSESDYAKLNEESPSNVFVMSVDDFCVMLGYELDNTQKTKINKYASCLFDTNKYNYNTNKLSIIIKSHGNNGEISRSDLLRYGHFKSEELNKIVDTAISKEIINEYSKENKKYYSLKE